MEEWRDIKGYEGIYQVSSLGRIRSLDRPGNTIVNRWGAKVITKRKGRIITPWLAGAGYLCVSLGRGNKRLVHRLVAETFVEGYAEGLEVDHINEDKTDNRAVNLRWVTRRVNNQSPKHVQKISASRSYKVMQYDGDILVGTYPSIKNASEVTGICKTTIAKHLRGKYKHAGGYIWKYEENSNALL